MKKIYLASSFAYEDKIKTEFRKSVMNHVSKILTEKGYNVYCPCNLKIENAWDYSMDEWSSLVFTADLKELNQSDIVVFLSYGKENNSGSVWEVGYAYGTHTPVVLVSMNEDKTESLMCVQSSIACLGSIDELEEYDLEKLPKVNTITNRTQS